MYFYPSEDQQKTCDSCGPQGMNGDLVILYDVNRDASLGDIKVQKRWNKNNMLENWLNRAHTYTKAQHFPSSHPHRHQASTCASAFSSIPWETAIPRKYFEGPSLLLICSCQSNCLLASPPKDIGWVLCSSLRSFSSFPHTKKCCLRDWSKWLNARQENTTGRVFEESYDRSFLACD